MSACLLSKKPGATDPRLSRFEAGALRDAAKATEQPKATKATETPKATDEYLAAHPEARHRLQHEHGGQITVDLLRETLAWVKTLEQTPLRAGQIASLEGRIGACDLDSGDAEPAREPGNEVTVTAGALKPRTPIPILNLKRAATPAKPSSAEVAQLSALRERVTRARKDARGYPAGAAIVVHADRLEAELAELEARMNKS